MPGYSLNNVAQTPIDASDSLSFPILSAWPTLCLLTAARYVELDPVRAGLVNAPSRYRWSSAAAQLRGRDDALVRVAPLLEVAPNWRRLLISVIREEELKVLRGHEHTGRPLGEEAFLAALEQNLGRI